MSQHRKPPTEDFNWAFQEALDVAPQLREILASPPLELSGGQERCAPAFRPSCAVGWIGLPQPIQEDGARLILFAWLIQGRSVPES